jgi:hypothetical protein
MKSADKAAAGEVLVRFRDDVGSERVEQVFAELKLEGERVSSGANLYRVRVAEGATVEETIEKLKTFPAVVYAEPNYTRKLK